MSDSIGSYPKWYVLEGRTLRPATAEEFHDAMQNGPQDGASFHSLPEISVSSGIGGYRRISLSLSENQVGHLQSILRVAEADAKFDRGPTLRDSMSERELLVRLLLLSLETIER